MLLRNNIYKLLQKTQYCKYITLRTITRNKLKYELKDSSVELQAPLTSKFLRMDLNLDWF